MCFADCSTDRGLEDFMAVVETESENVRLLWSWALLEVLRLCQKLSFVAATSLPGWDSTVEFQVLRPTYTG